jgi:ferredoxin
MQKMLSGVVGTLLVSMLATGCQKDTGAESSRDNLMRNADNKMYMLEYSKRARDKRRQTIDLKKVFEKEKDLLLQRYGSYENYLKACEAFDKKQDEKYRKAKLEAGEPVSTTTNDDRLFICWHTDYETKVKDRLRVSKWAYILDYFEMQGFDYGHDCDRKGTATNCVAKITNGYYDDSDQSALSDCERDLKYILPCVTYAESDIEMLGGAFELFLWERFQNHCPVYKPAGNGGI